MATQNPWDDVPVVRERPQAAQTQQASPWDSVPVAQAPQPRQTAPQAQQRPAPVVPPQPAQTQQGYFDQAIYDSFVGAGFAPEEATRFASDPTYMGSDEVGPEADYFEQPDLPVAEATPATGGENILDLTGLDPVQRNNALMGLGAGDRVRLETGEVVTLRGAPYASQSQSGTREAGQGLFLDEPDIGEAIGAGALAASEQIPGLDESMAFTRGALTGEGYDASREVQRQAAEYDRNTNPTARRVGGVAGFATGLLAPGGAYIARGATTGQRALRASSVSGAYGAAYGAGAADDSYASRLSGLGQGAVVGAATGGLLQMGADRLTRSGIASAQSRPGNARMLSREGVDLTPGQMLSEVPYLGSLARGLEEGASSIPVVGEPISRARANSMESFSIAAINRALRPIGERVPRSVEPGYSAVDYAQTAFNQAYDDALQNVTLRVDQDLIDNIGRALVQVAEEGGEPQARALTAAIQNRVFRNVGAVGDTINGQQFKAIESELGNLAREASSASDGASRALGRGYAGVRDALRGGLEVQNPQAAERLRAVNEGYANMARINQAASASPTMARDGVFGPTDLGSAVRRGATTNQLGRGEALMQDLASAGRNIIPSQTGDSGTARRVAVTGLATGAAGLGTIVNPQVVIPTILGVSAVYSRPAQALINRIYRASDNPGAAQRSLAQLAELAQRNPALQPYYLDAARHVGATLGQGVGGSQPAQPAVQNQAPMQRQAG